MRTTARHEVPLFWIKAHDRIETAEDVANTFASLMSAHGYQLAYHPTKGIVAIDQGGRKYRLTPEPERTGICLEGGAQYLESIDVRTLPRANAVRPTSPQNARPSSAGKPRQSLAHQQEFALHWENRKRMIEDMKACGELEIGRHSLDHLTTAEKKVRAYFLCTERARKRLLAKGKQPLLRHWEAP
jgi:hypothetical protein